MKATHPRWSVFVLLLASCSSVLAEPPCSEQAKPCLQISVRLYDYAKVPSRTLGIAKRDAAKILRRAGIETVWVDCAFESDETWRYPPCDEALSPTDIVLRILSSSQAPPWAEKAGVFGYAFPAKERRFGAVANVFYDRVEELIAELRASSAGRIFSPGVILGRLIAHEMGHLLLGANSHSRTGIMQFPLNRELLHLGARAMLVFTPSQAKQMQAQVVRRLQAKTSQPSRARNETPN